MNIPNRLKRVLAGTFILVQMGSMTGCQSMEKTPEKGTEQELLAIETPVESNKQEKSIEEKMTVFLTSLEEETTQITDTKLYYEKHQQEIEDYQNTKYDDMRREYAVSLYHELKETDVTDQEIAASLNNMMILQLNPTDSFTIDFWEEQFGPLLDHLQEDESLYPKYFTLAWLAHQAACAEKTDHREYNESGSYTCPTLERQYVLKYQ